MSYLDVHGLGTLWTKIKSWVSSQGYGTYSKPSGGIPKSDLESAVQTSLGKADSALQTAPVTSVNSKTGAVSLSAADVGAADTNHTHSYAGSSSVGGSANSAVKLDSSAGSATQPVYFSSGKPAACTYTLEKSVPSNAVFTDTDTKVTQTAVTASGYTNWRPLVIGSSNNATEGFSPSTVTDSTYTVNTLSCQPSSGTIKASTFKGNASSATKLATARTIGLGTGATGTATSFDGSANITIPVTSVKEAYLSWGGKNITGGYSPVDAAMVPVLGANRLAFMPAAGVEVQYSTNGGSTWSTYSTTDANKINLFNGNGAGHYIGASSATGIDKSNYQLRITITTNTANVYTALNKFVIYCSTNGSSGSWCTIDGKTKANVDSGTDTWVTFANKVSLSGWSGYNVINISEITTYGNTSAQYQKLRFTFGVTSHPSSSSYGGLIIYKIMGFGGMGWTTPSTMASNGHMYTYDASKNVTFPATVTATTFSGKLAASNVTAGTLAGSVVANASAVSTLTTKQVRNTTISTANPTSSDGGNGDIWIKYGSAQSNCPFPVGGIYISVSSTNPSSLWAGTTWEQFATGRTLVGINTSDTNFDTVEKTGGAATVTLEVTEIPSHTHTISSSGAHSHASTGRTGGSGTGANIFESYNGATSTRAVNVPRSGTNGNHTHTPGSTGGGGAHNNLQPYITVYMWKRVS